MDSNRIISLEIVRKEVAACHEDAESYGWEISEIDVDKQCFQVFMTSPIDNWKYNLYFQFDGYHGQPYLIDFIDNFSGTIGALSAYPVGKTDSFFLRDETNKRGIICNPCSRKAYSGYANLHGEWVMESWRSASNGLINLNAILNAIFHRISDKQYYQERNATHI